MNCSTLFLTSPPPLTVLTEILYASFANYSPRGTSELSERSRVQVGHIKAGRPYITKSAIAYFDQPIASVLAPFLNPDATLVPIPRSAPQGKDGIWPAEVIASLLVEADYGKEVVRCLERVSPVKKSSSQYSAQTRPSVKEHYDSLLVKGSIDQPRQITLIDDVLTLGRTAFACAKRIHEAFPESNVSVFALVRTQGLIKDIEKIVDPSTGTVTYNQETGKTSRKP